MMVDARTEAFAGIDVAFARGKALPVCVCVPKGTALSPLPLRDRSAPQPPRGQGNPRALDEAEVRTFSTATAKYLHELEEHFEVRITRVAIDAPSDPKRLGTQRRVAEVALDLRRISCFATPDMAQFEAIRMKALAHLAAGGAIARLPHANQLWMLVGFALFTRLREEWECLEVFPQATVALLDAGTIHKSKSEGLRAQLAATARYTGWPDPPDPQALSAIGHGTLHDRLDAYLAAWVASLDESEREPLGTPPNDVIWVPRTRASSLPA